ncbi:thioredoxin H1-like [Pistacia vera]|uniref:thioredoxin H1-like n=1 Tax=Pistacia vera TaxID=55513 RepID=UPI001262E8A4|nr:thioredoxin H1-like [Pistacia vera]
MAQEGQVQSRIIEEEEEKVIICHSVESFNEQLQKGIQSKKLIVVEFTASWCPPCRFIAPIVNEMAKKLPGVIFLKVNKSYLQSVAEDWDVKAMQTFVLLKESRFLERILGANKIEELQMAIAKHATPP